ncbi:MAG: hypothetical protein ACRDXE_03470, partial [Acidimicrobiales bacterium]
AAHRELPSGSRLVAMEVTMRPAEGPAETAPVAWFDAPAWASTLAADTPVVVIGRVRRRFFKAGGGTQSRTEVVAERVVPGGSRKRATTALAEASARLEAVAADTRSGTATRASA